MRIKSFVLWLGLWGLLAACDRYVNQSLATQVNALPIKEENKVVLASAHGEPDDSWLQGNDTLSAGSYVFDYKIQALMLESHVAMRQVKRLCAQIGARLSSVSARSCAAHNMVYSGHNSVHGRALIYKDIHVRGKQKQAKTVLHNSTRSSNSRQPLRVLFIGGIHGDEYSSFSLSFRLLDYFQSHAQSLKTGSIDVDWRIVPALNPDGLLSFKPSQRMNARGVDLNRNFLTDDWEQKAIHYWHRKTHKDKRRFPGKAAQSEPEVRWISQMIQTWRPDVVVSVHAPYGLLDFDKPNHVVGSSISAPKHLGFLNLKLLGTYPGSLGRYGAQTLSTPVLTIELPHAGIMPKKHQQETLWRDLNRWLSKYQHTR